MGQIYKFMVIEGIEEEKQEQLDKKQITVHEKSEPLDQSPLN